MEDTFLIDSPEGASFIKLGLKENISDSLAKLPIGTKIYKYYADGSGPYPFVKIWDNPEIQGTNWRRIKKDLVPSKQVKTLALLLDLKL